MYHFGFSSSATSAFASASSACASAIFCSPSAISALPLLHLHNTLPIRKQSPARRIDPASAPAICCLAASSCAYRYQSALAHIEAELSSDRSAPVPLDHSCVSDLDLHAHLLQRRSVSSSVIPLSFKASYCAFTAFNCSIC